MFAYIDETGNTGTRLLDENQPLFVTAALLTRTDFDKRFGDEVRTLASRIAVDEIHANQLGVGRLEDIAADLLRIIRKAGPAFFLARVEKRYVLASKVFDTLFDSYENKAVAWHIYNVRPLRITMVFKIAAILVDELAQQFWDALLDINATRARSRMAAFCKELGSRTGLIEDERSREIVTDALKWAEENPEALEFVLQDKMGRKGHSPNMVGFGNLLAGIERQSNVWNRPVEVIKHDRQHEFEANIKFWHRIYSNARADVVMLPLGEKMVLRKVFGSQLEISSAKESAGIQAIDVILWLFARALREDGLPAKCQALLDYVYSRAYQDDFSFAGVGATTAQLIEDIENISLSGAALSDARALSVDLEERRQREIAIYAQEQDKLDAV